MVYIETRQFQHPRRLGLFWSGFTAGEIALLSASPTMTMYGPAELLRLMEPRLMEAPLKKIKSRRFSARVWFKAYSC